MGRAEWRRRADDPKGPLGWWWRGFASTGWPYAMVFGPTLGFTLFSGSVVLAVSGVVLAVAAGTVRLVRTRDRLAPLLPEPAPEGQFRAAVEYRRDGLVTGRDEMALTVVDGWLVGEGLRSDFALRSVDVRRLRVRAYGARLLLEDGGEVRLLGLLDPGRAELGRWHDDEILPAGEPTFPPARAHEQEVARWGTWRLFGLGLILVPRGVAMLLHVWPAGRPFVAAVMMAGCGVGYLANRRWSKLVELSHAADRQDALAGQAPSLDLSLRPPLQNELSGEGESVRVR